MRNIIKSEKYNLAGTTKIMILLAQFISISIIFSLGANKLFKNNMRINIG